MLASFRSLSGKATLLVCALCLMTSAGVLTVGFWSMRQEAFDQLEKETDRARARATDVVGKIGERVDTYAMMWSTHPDIIGALKSGEKAKLQAVAVPLFKDLKAADPVVTSLEVTDAAGVVMMRGHNPSVNGDDKKKEPMIAGAISGKAGRDLTVSSTSGQVASDAVRPIVSDGRVIGTFKVGSYFRADTAREVKRVSGAEAVILYRGKINASTIENLQYAEVEAAIQAADAVPLVIARDGVSYETAARKLPAEGGDPVYLVSMINRGPALASLYSMVFGLFLKGLLAILVIVPVVVLVVRRASGAIRDLTSAVRLMGAGGVSQPVPHLGRSDEIGEIARAVDRTREATARTAMTVAAMNQSPTLLMITDASGMILFISTALMKLLKRLEPALRRQDPNFSVAAMTGQHVDCYRANTALRQEALTDDGTTQRLRYDIAGETVFIDLSTIHGDDGAAIGQTAVWRNVTAELLGQAEVAAVVEAAQRGDFSARLVLDDKDGFVREIAGGLNNVSALIEKATGDFASVMEAVARGDLTRAVSGAYQGVLGSLKDGINGTVSRLSETVTAIQATTADVAGAAEQINAGARDLANRTEDQASSLQETAATTEELAASVKTSAQSSGQAVKMADEAMRVAEAGGGVVRNAVDAMARIEQSSKRISDISSVIDGIAFQTNLLALNAAVEAARAGDAGRGFAVVASEVRSLAQRSADAAKDINQLISSTTQEIGDGVRLVRSAGDILGQIVESSQRVSTTVSEISAASGEQAHGIDEMSRTVARMDGMTQQNASLAEESASSATALSTKIAGLNSLVAKFRTRQAASNANGLRGSTDDGFRLSA